MSVIQEQPSRLVVVDQFDHARCNEDHHESEEEQLGDSQKGRDDLAISEQAADDSKGQEYEGRSEHCRSLP